MGGSQGNLPVGPGGALEVVVADITQPATLVPEMFAGVRAAVLASAVKVQPKEGDNQQRDKYMQVGHSPCLKGANMWLHVVFVALLVLSRHPATAEE